MKKISTLLFCIFCLLSFSAIGQSNVIEVKGHSIIFTPTDGSGRMLELKYTKVFRPEGANYQIYSYKKFAVLKQYDNGLLEFDPFKDVFMACGFDQCNPEYDPECNLECSLVWEQLQL